MMCCESRCGLKTVGGREALQIIGMRFGHWRLKLKPLRSLTRVAPQLRDIKILARRALSLDDHAKVFDDIYKENKWRVGSGPGSTVENTEPYRDFISTFLKERSITSVLDIGCGDWQFSRLIDWGNVRYSGADVSETALELARKAAPAGYTFMPLNATKDPLPEADLLIMKDVLQHWPNQDIQAFIPKLSTFKYALLTNGFPPNKMKYLNVNIRPGMGRPVELTAPPFNLPGSYVFDYTGDEPKRVLLGTRS